MNPFINVEKGRATVSSPRLGLHAAVERILEATLQTKPAGATHWELPHDGQSPRQTSRLIPA
jgi:hypothetical protein